MKSTVNQKLIHELEVHQIELELQNEELSIARTEAVEISAKYHELYDFAPIGYFSLSKEGDIIELNFCAAKLLGKERSYLINSNFGVFITKETRPVFSSFLAKIFVSNKKEACEVDLKINNNFLINICMYGIHKQDTNHCLVCAIDITERKQAETAIKIAKEHAEESDRLKSAFLANMSHEIRTPLNGILGFAEILKDQSLTIEETQEYIRIIEKGGKRMLNIINDLINISKIEAGLMEIHWADINVNEQIEYTHSFFEHEAQDKGLSLSFKYGLPSNKSWIKSDGEKVCSILTNLVKNAIKYTKEGSIEFGYNLLNGIQTRDKQAELEFYIKDTGMGVSKEQQKIIFERFRQGSESLTRNYEGAGLGLSISKALVEMLGGKIWVNSTEGKGSEFYFTIPYKPVQEKKVAKKPTSTVGEQNLRKTAKILIAEDEDTSDMLITIALKKIAEQVMHVKTGIQAVEACLNNPDIDLILMDIKMPEMNGYEATRQIRMFNKDVAIIAQTAYGLAGDREKSIAAGCNDYISKPISLAKFRDLIKKYIN